MSRTSALLAVLATMLLAACSSPAPRPAPEPTTAPTTESGFGGLVPSTAAIVPTVEPTAEPEGKTFTVTVGTIEDILTLQGEVAPLRVELSTVQDGTVARILVKPGDLVEEGQLIAEFDQGDLEGQLQQAELSLKEQQTTLNRQTAAAQIAVSQAEVDLQEAKDKLNQLKEPATALQIAEAREQVRLSEANLDLARNNGSQAKNLALEALTAAAENLNFLKERRERLKSEIDKTGKEDERKALRAELDQLEGSILAAESSLRSAQINFDTARNNEVAQVEAAESALALAQARLSSLLAGPDSQAIADAERAVRRAELQLAQVKLQTTADPSLSKSIEASQLEIAMIKELMAAQQIVAPMAGEVAAVNVGLNQPVQAGTSLVTLIDRSALEVIAAAEPARDSAPLVQKGQSIEITFDRYPDQRFSGKLTQLPSSADPESGDQSYHLSFDAAGRMFNVGDTASASLVLGRRTDTLLLPREAVRFSRDRNSVLLQTPDGSRRVEVLVGITTADMVEILGGVVAGDVVIVQQ